MNAEEIDFNQVYKNGLNAAKRMKLSDEESEEFAQEYSLKTLERGQYLRLDYFTSEYSRRMRTNKRILSHSETKFGATRRISLDASIDDSDSNSSKYSDIIGDSCNELGSMREFDELDWTVKELLRSCSSRAREWAIRCYYEFISSRI